MGSQAGGALTPSNPEMQTSEAPVAQLTLDTTAGSIPHWLARYYSRGRKSAAVWIKVYFTAILLTYVPVLLAALLSPLPLAPHRPFPYELKLPYLYDVNVAFLFLASFPFLLLIMMRDQDILIWALHQVQHEKVLVVSSSAAVASLKQRWEQRFHRINIAGQIVGLLIGIGVAYANYRIYVVNDLGFWITKNGEFLLVGYVYLPCIALCYVFIPLYVFRSLAFAVFLKDVVANSKMHLLALHPDHCGGLRPVGRIGIRNQYVLTVFGLNVVLLVVVCFKAFNPHGAISVLVGAGAVAYLVLGPLVFIAPLLPFRASMMQTKTTLMGEVAQRLRRELDTLRQKLPSGTITKEEEEMVDRLRKVGAILDELPVWPFDIGTVRKFLTAYVTPLVGAVAVPVLKILWDFILKKLHP